LKTCACPENRVSPEIFHCIEYIFYHSGFLSNFVLALKYRVALEFFTILNILFTFWILSKLHALALKNRGCPEFTVLIIYFLYSGFLSNLRFRWKTGLPWNFLLYWNIIYHSGFLSNCACPEKQRFPEMFRCMEYTFYILKFWAICMRLPWKTELPWYFSLYLNMYFYHSGFLATNACPDKHSCSEIFRCMEYTFYILNFWATCACPEKQRVPWIYCNEYIFFIIQDFWITCACPENQSALEFFTVLNIRYTSRVLSNFRLPWKTEVAWIYCTEYIFFIIQEFWVTCACSEKQSCPGIFHCIEYTFYILNFWATCACPEKQRVASLNLLYWIYIFYHSGVLSNLLLPWKTELLRNFLLYGIYI